MIKDKSVGSHGHQQGSCFPARVIFCFKSRAAYVDDDDRSLQGGFSHMAGKVDDVDRLVSRVKNVADEWK